MYGNSEKSAEREAAALVRRVAEPRLVDDSVKAAIRRASRRLKWSYSRTKHVWYGTAVLRADEMDCLRQTAGRDARGTDEISNLRERLARIERHLDLEDAAEAGAADDLAGVSVRRRGGVARSAGS